MSTPSANHRAPAADDQLLIDRLVDGDLSDAERRALLLHLEADPGGWRRCALAFLEAQTWREALGPLAAPAMPRTTPGARGRGPRPWRRLGGLAGLAAGLAAAFVLGWVLRGGAAPDAPITRGPAPAPAPVGPPPPAPVEVASGESRAAEPADAPDPALKQWEQRGYRAESQKRVVSLELKDGRKLDVPVQEVRLQYVGGRTY